MSLENRMDTEEAAVTACLERLRAKVTRLEQAVPTLIPLTLAVRHEMIDLLSHVRALRTTHAAARMVGLEAPLAQQAPIEELPIFNHGHVLTAHDVQRMNERPGNASAFLQSLHRAGDHSLDPEEKEAA